MFGGCQFYHNYVIQHGSRCQDPRWSLRDWNQGRQQMDNSNPERKEKVKKLTRLGFKITLMVIDYLIWRLYRYFLILCFSYFMQLWFVICVEKRWTFQKVWLNLIIKDAISLAKKIMKKSGERRKTLIINFDYLIWSELLLSSFKKIMDNKIIVVFLCFIVGALVMSQSPSIGSTNPLAGSIVAIIGIGIIVGGLVSAIKS